jgi:hypothetical protein
MNMTTSLDNIPLKTAKNTDINIDDKDDPMVKDILNEFQQELEINTRSSTPPLDNYQVNYSPPQKPDDFYDPPKKLSNKHSQKNQSYYNQDYIKKTGIIIAIIAIVFSPFVFTAIIEKVPLSFAEPMEKFDFYIKLIASFVIIYVMYFYNLL